ncbi:hypothetical protein [Chitinilyticum aquatile]|uniref:hypothetical protein n=1 Tax=Chitinilyticum aquatile TaxID=362520 RepID=UPI00040895E9|nr:hypothetical protein [Chitinilyticum aquatile]
MKIGQIKCPCCGNVQPLTEQANGLAIMSCNWCNVKVQAYGKDADTALRRMAGISQVKQEPEKAPEVVPEKKPNPAGVRDEGGIFGRLNNLLSEAA